MCWVPVFNVSIIPTTGKGCSLRDNCIEASRFRHFLKLFPGMKAEENEQHLGMGFPNLPTDFNAVHSRHLKIDNDHTRTG